MNTPRLISAIIAVIALLICFVSPFLVFCDVISMQMFKNLFNWATLIWFLSAPYAMVPELLKKSSHDEKEPL